jgi:hypothetical protein
MTTPNVASSTRVTEHNVYHHSSETARCTNPAGGDVPRDQYENKTLRPAHTPNQSLPLSEVIR